MKLQLALDDITLDAAVELLKEVSDHVDIIEIGTPFVIEYGMEAVRTIRKHFPNKEILCDAKIMDGGTIEANSAFRAGSDYVTVLGVTDKATLNAVVQAAKVQQKRVVVDLLCVESFEKTIPALEDLGVDMVAVHVGVDQQISGRTPLQDLIEIKSIVKRVQIAVAGGINSKTLAEYLVQKPDIVIVGGAIINAADPATEAKNIYSQIQEAT